MKYIKSVWIVALLILTANIHAQPAVLPAKVDVSAIGAATYTIPIEVVPGTKGVQPNLSISYNSMSGLGILGSKWCLSGISAITRTCQTSFFDGNISPIGYDTTDRFSLDGQRMVLFDGSSYQCNNAVYCFEVEDFSRITKVGAGNDFYFKQTLADGSIIEFGRTNQCKLAVGSGKYLSWMVDKVIDPCGNYMKYYYQQSNGEIWVDHIDYTILSDGTPAYASVLFEYENMSTPNDGFVNGYQVRQSKRLKNIIVKYQGTQVRKYSFAYNTDLQYDRLTEVTLYDAENVQLSSTSITWSTPSSTMTTDETITLLSGGYYTTAGNFDDNRINDIYAVARNGNGPYLLKRRPDGSGYTWTSAGNQFPVSNFDNLSAVDIDGDGIDEVIYRDRNTSTYYSLKVATTYTPTPEPISYTYADHLIWGDFDGDGVLEPVAFAKNDSHFNFKYLEGTTNTVATLPQSYEYCYAGDFDGDGKTDLMFLKELYSHIYTYNTRTHVWEQIESDGFPNAHQKLVVGDYNGDGMSDVLFLPKNESHWKLAIRFGKNNWTYPVQVIPEMDGTHYTDGSVEPKYLPIACDINGDGKCDILQPVANYTVRYIVSKGCHNGELQYAGSSAFTLTNGQLFKNDYFSMGDFDGNGIVDFLFSNPNQGGLPATIKYLYKDSFPGFFVNQISDAASKNTRFEYSTISLMPNRFYGTGINWMPLPLVKNLIVSNGIGGMDTTSFYYGNAQYDIDRHQFIGFAMSAMKSNNKVSETFMSRVRRGSSGSNGSFSMLVPDSVVNYIAPSAAEFGNSPYWSFCAHLFLPTDDNLISRTTNTYNTLYRTNVSGNVSFLPYAATSTTYNHRKNTKVIKTLSMNGSNWHPTQEYTQSGYISGSTELPIRQYVNYTYTQMTLLNGVSVLKPTKQVTRNYNNTSNSYPRRDTVSFSYTTKGLMLSKQHSDNSGLSVTESYLYNANGLPKVAATTPRGEDSRTVTVTYDPTCRFVTRSIDHAGNETQKTYDPATGHCLSETGIDGLTVLYEYDSWGRPTKVTYPDATTKNIQYTNTSGGLGNACCYTTVTENGKPETRTYYDYLGRKTHTYVSGQGYTDIVYNKLGQVMKQTQVPYANTSASASSKKWESFRYDAFGRMVRDSSNYQEDSYSYHIDNTSHLYKESVTNKLGAVSTKYFDAAGRVARVEDDGGDVTYTYDRVSQSGKVYDRLRITTGGKTTTVVTDSRDNRLSLTDPDAGTTTSTYDSWGCLLTQTDGKGDVTTMEYDNQSRVISKTYSLGNSTDAFTYNYGTTGVEKGKVTRVNHNGTVYQEFSYDAVGRMSSATKYIESVGYTHQYAYNSDGQLYTTTYPSGFVLRHEYDTDGRLKNLKDNATNMAIYTIDSRNTLSQPKRCWFGNNTGVEYTYNAWGLPTQIKYGHREVPWPFDPLGNSGGDEIQGGGILDPLDPIVIGEEPIVPIVGPTFYVGSQYSVLQYSYNDNGYITRKKETKTSQQEDFTYDVLGRLTSVSVNNTLLYDYTYESNGNVKKNSRIGSNDYEYDADKPHAVVGVLDENGALPTSQCDVTYNSRNRAATISENGWTMELSYGGGLQREKSVLRNGNTPICTTYFISKDCEYEIKSTYSRYINYIYAEGKIVALHVHNITANADSLYYVQTDLLGSWDRIVNGSRQVVQSSHFDPWGNRMSASDWTVSQDGSDFAFRRGFTGHEHYDRFGIINMNARLYDPVLGRFFSPDPQVQNPYSTQGFNRYSYCGNNPVMCIDEDGEFGILAAILIGAAIVGSINVGIHIEQGDVSNFWQGLGYFAQGAVAGAFIGVTWYGGISLFASGSLGGKAFLFAKGVDAISTGLSMFQNPTNATRIFLGRYYFDENMAHGFSQAFTRYTWEALQTWGGYNATQIRNLVGKVSRVDYLGGTTFATNEHSSHHRGFTIGNYVNMSIRGEINMPFRDWCLYGDQMYLHEYGHTIQSQLTGFAYLFAIGLPSLISCENSDPIGGDPYQASTHDYFYTETWANRIASWYFAKYYGYEWHEHNGYPFYDYR